MTDLEVIPEVFFTRGVMTSQNYQALFNGAVCGALGIGILYSKVIERYGSIFLVNVIPSHHQDPDVPIPSRMTEEMSRRYKEAMSVALETFQRAQLRYDYIEDFVRWFLKYGANQYTSAESNYFVLHLRRMQNEILCEPEVRETGW